MDLCSTSSAVLTPNQTYITFATGIYGPLPDGTVGLILGRSSTSLQGIKVIPGVIDADFTGEIKIMLEPPIRTIQIHPGQRIAQLVVHYYHWLLVASLQFLTPLEETLVLDPVTRLSGYKRLECHDPRGFLKYKEYL